MSAQMHHGDCLEVMAQLPDASVDMILCDLPYGTTACKWDTVIPFEPLWAQYRRVAKRNAAIVLTASQPFTTALIASNLTDFRYALVWEKERPSNPGLANKQFMKWHEDVCVFADMAPIYNPQMSRRDEKNKRNNKLGASHSSAVYGGMKIAQGDGMRDARHPSSVLRFNVQRGLHPTQKPVALMEYLIRTYTQGGETVLDSCMGSGTTGVACVNTGRQFIGIERDDKYFSIASDRIAAAERQAA